MKYLRSMIFLFLLYYTDPASAQSSGYKRIRVEATPEEMQQWATEDLLPSHFHYQHGTLEMELDPAELSLFLKKNIRFEDITFKQPAIHTAGTASSYRTMSAPVNFSYGSMGGYYTYQEVMDVLDSMRVRYPELVSVKDTIGTTYEGRPVVAIRISDHPDSSESNEDEWLMTSLHHANEVLGVHVALYFAWHLLENYNSNKEISDLLNNSALYLVPVVNPDGLVHNENTNPAGGGTWRKNRSPRVISSTTHYGVDLNRNYGFKWAYSHPGQLGQAGSNFAGNSYYRGTAAWSEFETQAIRNLCNNHRFTAAFNYHAWDDSFNYPWNFDIDSLTNDSLKFHAIAQYCTEDNLFETGTFDQTLGYTANGTSDDWLYGEQATKNKIFAFTIEVGKSFWPSQSLIIPYCDSLLQANIKMLRMAAKYADIEETGADTLTSLSAQAAYTLKRYSIKDTGFTVSVIPLDSYIISAGPDNIHPGISFLGVATDSIGFALSPSTPAGAVIRFILKVDNGAWFTVDTISKIYMPHAVLPAGCEDNMEPNNTMQQATAMHPGGRIASAIGYKGDEDWFYFQNNTAKKNIRIILSDLPADYDIELFDETGKKSGFSSRPYKMNDTIVYNTQYTGSFRLRVNGYKNAYHPFHCYLAEVQLGSSPFDEVRNNSKKGTGEKEIVLSVFPVPSKNDINVTVHAAEFSYLLWRLVDVSGRQFVSGSRKINEGFSVFSIGTKTLPPGFYVLIIEQPGGNKRWSFKIVKD